MLPADLDIAVIAPFPVGGYVREGWMSRIASIDHILSGLRRLYIHFAEHHRIHIDDGIIQQERNGWELRLHPGEKAHRKLLRQIVERVRGVYVHTVPLAEWIQECLPSGKCIVDMHGIAPEEESMLGRPEQALRYQAVEQNVLAQARRVVVVTNAMARHFLDKYPTLTPSFVTLPIVVASSGRWEKSWAREDTLPVSVVYAGGGQPWQNLDAMLRLADRCREFSTFTFLSQEAQELQARAAKTHPHVVASYQFCEKSQLPAAYARHDFGLVLRDDMPVNRVSCPTKLSEYLSYDVVPIVRSPHLGDFAELGYWYVTEEEFAEGFFPDTVTRQWMTEANREVIGKLRQCFVESAAVLRRLFSDS